MNQRIVPLLLLAVAGLGLAGAVPAHAQFGITAGANFDRLSDITLNNTEAHFDNHNGWHVGVWADFSLLGVLTLRPGVRYMSAGKLFEGLSEIDGNAEDTFDINLMEIPVLVRFAFGAPVIKPYIFAGPVLRFPVGVDNTIDSDLKSPSIAGEVGLGVQVALGRISLYPEVGFTFGLSSFIDDEIILGFATFSTNEAQHLNAAMLRLGIGL